MDYDYAFKDDVIRFEAESNGRDPKTGAFDHLAKIQTFVGMNAKGILKDLVRVAGLPISDGNMLAKQVPEGPKVTLKEAWEKNPELREIVEGREDLARVWNFALKLEGTKKASSLHACGHIPTPVPCEELFPCAVDPASGYLVCQYDAGQAEHLGNLKKDLLMLRNLTIIDIAQKQVKKRYGVDVPLWTDEILNDAGALAVIAAGETNGIFQLESAGMKGFMKKLRPDCFEDIIAGVSLYRPGPMEYIDQYCENKKHPEKILYAVPQLKPILEPTYGIITYQEQVMNIVRQLGGFSMARADLLRKAMGELIARSYGNI